MFVKSEYSQDEEVSFFHNHKEISVDINSYIYQNTDNYEVMKKPLPLFGKLTIIMYIQLSILKIKLRI